MYTTEIASKLSTLLDSGDIEGFLTVVSTESESGNFSDFADAIHEEWRKLQIAKKNGLMDEEQIKFALTSFFSRESENVLSESDE